MQARPILFGEVLFDCFPDGQRVLGGAPFNVCWHLQQFGERPLLISRVGDDAAGAEVRQRMQDAGMDTSALQTDPRRPTGEVAITLAAGGQPTFDIRADQAYDHIDPEPVLDGLAQTPASLIYRGTLAARSPENQSALQQIQQAAGPAVYVDVNLRPPWWQREAVLDALSGARWAKLNDAELVELTGCEDDPAALQSAGQAARDTWGLALLIVTLGARGALWIDAAGIEQAPAPSVEQIADTVGAGDAFSAVSLLGLLRGWPGSVTLRRALAFAADVCRNRGAVIADRAQYQRTQDRWNREQN